MREFRQSAQHGLALSAFCMMALVACGGNDSGAGTNSSGTDTVAGESAGTQTEADQSAGDSTADASGDDGSIPATPDALPAFRLQFEPDPGIRLACASVPRIGKASRQGEELFYLYHSSHLDSGSAGFFATSNDGQNFSASTSANTRLIDLGGDRPEIAVDRSGFPEVVEILPSSGGAQSTCGNATHRIFHANGAFGSFGDAISADCSDDGQWFIADAGESVQSPDGGNMGVTTAFRVGNHIHLLTMDGKSPNAMGEYRHRVWHYVATDGRGDSFTLVSDDPLGNGATVEAKDRQNDPMSYTLASGDVVVLTMKQHNGPIKPSAVLTGEIYGWYLDQSQPDSVQALPPAGGSSGDPLIAVEDFVAAGHMVASINDPTMIKLDDGRYRLYVGALVAINGYPENASLSECDAGYPEGSYSWVILSATATAPAPGQDAE